MISLADIEKAAASVLGPAIWDFVTGGSGDEQTLRANRAALDAVAVVPRVLSGVGGASAATVLLASPSEFPAAVAPMAYQRLVHPDGEVALAQAAYLAGIPYVVSTLSSSPVEEIAATGAELWFQLYWLRDRDVVPNLMRRAEHAGCRALIVTVDVPVMGRRRRDIRNSFALLPSISASHLPAEHTAGAQLTDAKTSALAAHTQSIFDPAFGWEDLAWLAERTSLPLVVKGILDPDDARRGARMGVAAVVVSNHGGRQFDGAPPSITALAAIVEGVACSCHVLPDSGIRSGKDMLRALACGADGVLIGRPLLWGLAAAGAASYLTHAEIGEGIARLARFIRTEACHLG